MYIKKIDIPVRAYTTVATYYYSTHFTGQLIGIGYDPSSYTPLCDTTKGIFKVYRNSSKYACDLIFKHALPSTAGLYHPTHRVHDSTGAISTSDAIRGYWDFADDRIRLLIPTSTDGGALRATFNFYIA